jgi:hypothetical protein
MANIVGEPFDEYVSKQILNRQKIHGQGATSSNRDNLTLSYLNSRTSWIKLSSGVSIYSGERLDRIGLNNHSEFVGPNGTNTGLSNFFVLFNGTSDNAGTPYGGIDVINGQPNQDMGQSILNKVAYGIGGTEFGLRPMPGITSCETKFRNRGSIREGTVNIKAYNRSQLEIISLLYLRLGFPMLLEWGHSIIVDKEGKIDTKPDFSISKNFLGLKYKTTNKVLEALETQRESSACNYDGMYGQVVNFDWTFNKDGSYDITLKLISIGAIVESLKVNTYIKDFKSSTSKPSDSTPETDEEWITTYKYSHTIGEIFFKAYTKLEVANSAVTAINNQAIQGELSTFDKVIDYIPFARLFFQPEIPPGQNKDYIRLTGSSGLYYVRFAEFLRILQLLIPNDVTNPKKPASVINIGPKNNKGEPLPIITYTENYQISGDPKVCIIGGFKMNKVGGKDVEIIPDLSSNSFKISANGIIVGDLNNVYINMAFILQKLNDLQDGNNKVILIDLLKNVLEGINKSLGGINQLEASIDETTNIVKIIDQTPIPGFDKAFPEIANKLKEAASFNLYGYYLNKSSAGFIKDFSLKTEITNGLVSMLTIGATANGQVVGEDATAFSKWNEGLKPIINDNLDYSSSETSKKNYQQQYEEILKSNYELRDKFVNYVINIYNELASYTLFGGYKQKEDYLQIVVNYLAFENQYSIIRKKYMEEIKSNYKNKFPAISSATSSRGFLPINFSLTMDGLSGIKIYQQIKVDTAYLPTEYPTALKFLIKGVTNKVDSSGWTTSIETVSVPVIDIVENTPVATSSIPAQSITSVVPSVITAPAPADRAESRNCGEPLINQISSNPSNIGNARYADALNQALQNTFKGGPGEPKKCALYTYSTATAFVNILKGLPPGPQFTRGKGNAKDVSTRTYLKSLGYSVDKWAENISKTEINKLLNNRKYNIGDILIYWANDGNPSDGCTKYGHIEIYSGKVWNPYNYVRPETNFVSSVPDNYTTNPFVYGKQSQNCWNVYLCKAPMI